MVAHWQLETALEQSCPAENLLLGCLSLVVPFCGSSILNISRSSRGSIFFKNLPENVSAAVLTKVG